MDEEALDDYLFLKEVDNTDYSEEESEDFSEDDLFDQVSEEEQLEIEEDISELPDKEMFNILEEVS